MKTAFVLFLVVLFNSNSDLAKGSIAAGEAPLFVATKEFDFRKECEETLRMNEKIAAQRGDKLIFNNCFEIPYPTAPETTL